MLHRTITIVPAQMLAIDTSPLVVVPAPGPGLYLTPDHSSGVLRFKSIPYIAGSDLKVWVNQKGPYPRLHVLTQPFISGNADSIEIVTGQAIINPRQAQPRVENQPIIMQAIGAGFAAGDSDLVFTLWYNMARTT